MSGRLLGVAIARASMFPLDAAYARDGLEAPLAVAVRGRDIPKRYRPLLVHATSMTLTLERFVGARIGVRVLGSHRNGTEYLRRVLLVGAEDAPAVIAAVSIRLDRFGAAVQQRIVDGDAPLGRVLHEHEVAVETRPIRFFAVVPNAEMEDLFTARGGSTLYGRQTQLWCGGEKVADVAEVLSPSIARGADGV